MIPRKAVAELVDAKERTDHGNHSVLVHPDTRRFLYHWTVICKTDEKNKTFQTSTGDYGSNSTRMAINAYIEKLTEKGYKHLGEVSCLSK